MNKRKSRFFTALLAVILCMAAFSTVVYASSGEGIEALSPPATVPAPNPFTPEGTGTVMDNAADTEGKEFFTITTPAENVFYLVIDRQRGTDNIYFLNAVTEKDLLALVEASEDSGSLTPAAEPQPTPESVSQPEENPLPQPETKSNGGAMFIMLLIAAAMGGGAFYYFKIIKSKPASKGGTDLDEYDFDDEDEEESPEFEDEAPFSEEDDADAETRNDLSEDI